MKIIIGCDHAGFLAKKEILEVLEHLSCTYEDVGVFNKESVHYPKIAKDVCKKLLHEKFDFGILICGSGTGMAIAANRFEGIRAALCYDTYSAKMARYDNNCNVLCLRSREFDHKKYFEIIKTFIETEFSIESRHHKRVDMLDIISKEEF